MPRGKVLFVIVVSGENNVDVDKGSLLQGSHHIII